MASTSEQSALVAQLQSEEFHWMDAVGGWRGIAESVLPVLVFLVGFTVTRNLWVTAAIAAGVSVVFILTRLAVKQPITQAFGGVFAVGISLAWALWSGREENFFAFGLILAMVCVVALAVSNVAKKPLVGLVLGTLWSLPAGWMADFHYRAFVRACTMVTWLWAGMFALRLAVQVPLWWGGFFEALATAKLALGLPLLAVVGWLSWLMLRPYAGLATSESVQDSTLG